MGSYRVARAETNITVGHRTMKNSNLNCHMSAQTVCLADKKLMTGQNQALASTTIEQYSINSYVVNRLWIRLR